MTTTYTARVKPDTTYTARVKPVKYIQLLQDAFDSVRDLDWNDIYVYSNTWTPIEWTLWTARTPI